MANEITLNIGLSWRKNNQAVSGSVGETYDQVGNAAIGQIQSVNSTTETIVLAEIAGAKYLMLKNMAPKATTANPQPILWVDTVTPVVPGSATAIKIVAGAGVFLVTPIDTYYTIAAAAVGDAGPNTVALPVDLSVVAIEV